MSSTADSVTDHAVMRYLERVYGVDVPALKRRIALATKEARAAGASGVKIDGVRYVLSPNGRVVTIDAGADVMPKRGRRWKARRK